VTILCLDIGNTSITYCKVIDSKFQSLDRYASSDKLSSLLDSIDLSNVHTVVISSVVPSLSKKLYDLLKSKKIEMFEVSHKNSGIQLMVDNPSEVGYDRICNVAAANNLYSSPSIIIDFGTATTYDIIDEKGNFIGGAIAPGIDVSANHLIARAELLKEVAYQFPSSIIGKNTISNIQSGVMFGGLHSVTGMIHQIREEMSSPSCNIILTGGFGELISSSLSTKHTYNQYLTIHGMLSIYRSNT